MQSGKETLNCGSLFHTHGGEQLLGTPLLSLNLAQLAEYAHTSLLQVVLGEAAPVWFAQQRFTFIPIF